MVEWSWGGHNPNRFVSVAGPDRPGRIRWNRADQNPHLENRTILYFGVSRSP
jgi:hypothetical protein